MSWWLILFFDSVVLWLIINYLERRQMKAAIKSLEKLNDVAATHIEELEKEIEKKDAVIMETKLALKEAEVTAKNLSLFVSMGQRPNLYKVRLIVKTPTWGKAVVPLLQVLISFSQCRLETSDHDGCSPPFV